MKKETVVQFGDPVLRQVASPITVFHKKLRALIDTIAFTLESRGDGAALAAPQIGVSKRVVVIDYQDEYIEMVNPEITEMSGAITDGEGCLSFKGYSGEVTRAENVTVKFQDRFGEVITLTRSGPMARCMQHEIDHLDGILYIDRMEKSGIVMNEDKETMEVEKAIAMSREAV
jgi:peptide deformylase